MTGRLPDYTMVLRASPCRPYFCPGAPMAKQLTTKEYKDFFAQLGITDAPLTRKGLAKTLGFFEDEMPTLPWKYRIAFLKAMDLHHPVEVVTLQPGEKLTAYRKHTEDPFKTFY